MSGEGTRPMSDTEAGPRSLQRILIVAFALIAVAMALRSICFGQIFTPRGIIFPMGADEYYHLRRILDAVVRFPHILGVDSYVNFPHGGRAIWPVLFDWMLAAAVRVLDGNANAAQMERIVVWAPALLGTANVLLAAWLARRLHSPLAGLLAGMLLAVLPAHWSISRIGLVDHHVAVALLATMTLAAGLGLLGREGTPTGTRIAVLLGLGMGGSLALWSGSLLHILPIQAAGVLYVLAARTRERAVSRSAAWALAHIVSAVVVAPFCLGLHWSEFGNFTPLVLTRFQPTWLASGAAALGVFSLIWSRSRLGNTRSYRLESALALGALGIGAALWLLPELREGVGRGAGWFAKSDALQSQIVELQPLLFSSGRFDPSTADASFSLLFWAFPPAALWLAWKRDPRRLLLVGWSSFFFVATLSQLRFLDNFSVGFSLVLGIAGAKGWQALQPHVKRRPIFAASVLAALALITFLPVARFYANELTPSLAAWRGKSPDLPLQDRRRLAVERAAHWLGRASPQTSGYLDPAATPEYGVLSAWDFGHLIRYRARRPMIQDNFWSYVGADNFARAGAYFDAADEGAALAEIAPLQVHFVVSTANGSGQHSRLRADSMAGRLFLSMGSRTKIPGVGVLQSLQRHRLVYVERDRIRARGSGPLQSAGVRIFELVPGARLIGKAAAGEHVELQLPLELGEGPPWWYRQRTAAQSDGHYQFRVPYPTDAPVSDRVRAAGLYRILVGDQIVRVPVAEEAVQAGASIAVPRAGRL